MGNPIAVVSLDRDWFAPYPWCYHRHVVIRITFNPAEEMGIDFHTAADRLARFSNGNPLKTYYEQDKETCEED